VSRASKTTADTGRSDLLFSLVARTGAVVTSAQTPVHVDVRTRCRSRVACSFSTTARDRHTSRRVFPYDPHARQWAIAAAILEAQRILTARPH
jgi:hypothetical protein